MAKAGFISVDEYIAAQPEAVRSILRHVRGAMPTYKLYGRRLLYFAAWKQHYALYASTEQVLAEFREELAAYEIDKGTIRFPLSRPVPVNLIARIAKFRTGEVAAS